MPDNMTLSRLELRLETEIRAAPSVLEADCKRAELAAYRVRLGRVKEVELTLHELHQRYKANPNVAISAWLNLVEGLVGHFGDMDPGARDKVLRAHALSSAAGLLPMRALTAAWLAHFDYARLDLDSAEVHVRLSIACSNQTDDSVRSRASLVVAQTLHLAGRFDMAKPWYAGARLHANREGDSATVGAILHNMAWLHMSIFRQANFSSELAPKPCFNMLMSAESTKNFDQLFKINTLTGLEPILRAQILSLRGRWAEALDLYNIHFSSISDGGTSRFLGISLSDQAWCRLNVGDKAHATEDALAASKLINEHTQVDDRAFAHSRLAQVFDALGDFSEVKRHRELATNFWRLFERLQKKIVENYGNIQ